ncbi:DNA polymerase [Escherichia coli]
MERTRARAKEQGYVEMLNGRVCICRISDPAMVLIMQRLTSSYLTRQCREPPPRHYQTAMIAVDAWLQAEQPRVRMIMQVHDELVFEVHKDDVDAVAKQIHQLMENCTRLDVPLLVEVGSGENWDQAH